MLLRYRTYPLYVDQNPSSFYILSTVLDLAQVAPPQSTLATHISPGPRAHLEMVITLRDYFQLNSPRRIRAETQHRINGFNVYG